jgi:predicted dienelactone hydrolase
MAAKMLGTQGEIMGKKMKIALITGATLLAGAVLFIWNAAIGSSQPVGFQITRTKDAAGQAFPIAVWYPTSGSPRPTTLIGNTLLSVAPDGPLKGKQLPLIVISHGNGGSVASHADLAMALADAGYVVAAPMHPGDNFQDRSALAKPNFFAKRAGQVQATIGHLLSGWATPDALAAQRVGVFGFSAGAASALLAAGAKADFSKVAPHCAAAPDKEFVCQVLKQAGSPLLQGAADQAIEPSPHIRALVLAAPGMGFTMDGSALNDVQLPVQLWSGQRDTTTPYDSNARHIREGFGARLEYIEAPGAQHLSFLAPCRLFGPPAICADPDGFDRQRFHADMNRKVIEFLDRHLAAKQ